VRTAGEWVGREPELAVLDDALVRLADGAGGAFSISGEPGVGKSRLVAEVGKRAEARGATLFEGQATELEREFPFGLIVDALDPYLASVDDTSLRALTEDQRQLLAVGFPARAGRERENGPVAEERFRCHRAVRELLSLLASNRPVVLALDDLQ
jgi:hypothetical protein